jgi:type IV fimbrial biogenesis protein FimT
VLIHARRSAGFSLIELLIGIVVMGILLALGLPAFTTWLQSAQIRTAAESIQNGLQFARSEAVRLNATAAAPVIFTLNGPDSTWTVISGAQTLQQRSGAEGSRNAVVSWLNPAPTVATLPVSISFNGLGQTDLTGSAWIQITNPTGGTCGTATGNVRCLNITVSTSGQVKMCDPQVSAAGDSRTC